LGKTLKGRLRLGEEQEGRSKKGKAPSRIFVNPLEESSRKELGEYQGGRQEKREITEYDGRVHSRRGEKAFAIGPEGNAEKRGFLARLRRRKTGRMGKERKEVTPTSREPKGS